MLDQTTSRPTRARGLKQAIPDKYEGPDLVAPHAGAWIETCSNTSVSC